MEKQEEITTIKNNVTMQSSLKKGTTPYFKSERFLLHSQHEMQNYTWTISYSLFYRML